MKKERGSILLSASDLSSHLACAHLTELNLSAVNGSIDYPNFHDPTLDILLERGLEFERAYLERLCHQGLKIICGADNGFLSVDETIAAMQKGADVIYQASLRSTSWRGRADFLIRVNSPSYSWPWSYEVLDTKLARETRTGTILQLCLYSEMIADIQGAMPQFAHVITPENEFTRHTYRLDDFSAYYRQVKKKLEARMASPAQPVNTYPLPCAHCVICNWWKYCDDHRRTDDHLSLVAGLSNGHSKQINQWKVSTVETFAALPLPLPFKPSRGAIETYERLREQARVQLESRLTSKPVFEYLEVVEDRGLFQLPEPSEGDIFFDFEGDPFAGTSGLEYLFGWVGTETPEHYECLWALNPVDEKKAFETFVDLVMIRWKKFPSMHIYHFTAYEPSALKRLMGKHAARENEMDTMLRAELFVDLHTVTRQAIRAGVETYSLKELEKFHDFSREMPLRDAARQLRAMEAFIERNNTVQIPQGTRDAVAQYNKEDCLSTRQLRSWLESIRGELIQKGHSINRPDVLDGAASEKITAHQQKIKPLYDTLVLNIPVDPMARTPAQQACWILANFLDWYPREKKSLWWEYFRLLELPGDQLLEEKSALAGLQFTGKREPIKRSVIDEYTFPRQDCDIGPGHELQTSDGKSFGQVVDIDNVGCRVQIKKGPGIVNIHPSSVFHLENLPDEPKIGAIIRIAEWVAVNGVDAGGAFGGHGEYRAGRDLLLRAHPRTNQSVKQEGEQPHQIAVNWAKALDNGVLPIQGPPGSGKSHTAAAMILDLVQAGKKIGITALGHKVIVNLMQKVIAMGKEKGINVRSLRKVTNPSAVPDPDITEETDNKKLLAALQRGAFNVIGGTAWLWAREDMAGSVDVLFVDEAGQLSLIDTVAVSQGATNLVLLGDPQQLKQPQQGSHPDGTEVSALEHILQQQQTIHAEQGIFLNKTWRMHPDICTLVSELFYEGRLRPMPGLEYQRVLGHPKYTGAGIWFEGVSHEGNQSHSIEEVQKVKTIVEGLLADDVFYIDKHQQKRKLLATDIKVIAPYNLQVNLLTSSLQAEVQVGTVDKFQGQEAPVIIFSMATSSPEDAPRGMDFLYSLNRLNVAVSRAKAVFILVCSPKLFEPECKHIQQMKLANAFCRLMEVAK